MAALGGARRVSLPTKLPKVTGVPCDEFRRAITNSATIQSLREFQMHVPLALRDKPEALFQRRLHTDTKRLVLRGGDCVPLVARARALTVLTVLTLDSKDVAASRAGLVALYERVLEDLLNAIPGRLERSVVGLMYLKNHAVSLVCLLRWLDAENPSLSAPKLAVQDHYNSLSDSRDGLSAAEEAKERAENPFLSIGLPSTLKMATPKSLK